MVMSGKILGGVVFIFFCTTIAWVILGLSIVTRTQSKYKNIGKKVEGLWGSEHTQVAPTIYYETTRKAERYNKETKRYETHTVTDRHPVELESSDIQVKLDLAHRKKGLLWYSTFKVDFQARHSFKNPLNQGKKFFVRFLFPTSQAIYDGFRLEINDKKFQPVGDLSNGVVAPVHVKAGGIQEFVVSYRSQGLDRWQYKFGKNVKKVQNYSLVAEANFKDIDFPDKTISPTEKKETQDGWLLTWKFADLVTGVNIGIEMPEKMNPGQLASKITFFAPIPLFLYFFTLVIISTLKETKIHPMNYFFLAATFFAFHLLYAYLADHLPIHLTFVLCTIVSLSLGIYYLQLVVDWFLAIQAGVWQFIFLVLFSYAFFFPGYTGLIITIGCIATLAILMKMTGKVDWSQKFPI